MVNPAEKYYCLDVHLGKFWGDEEEQKALLLWCVDFLPSYAETTPTGFRVIVKGFPGIEREAWTKHRPRPYEYPFMSCRVLYGLDAVRKIATRKVIPGRNAFNVEDLSIKLNLIHATAYHMNTIRDWLIAQGRAVA